MKTLKMAAIMLVFFSTTSALAITGRDNWQAIRGSREVLIQQPLFASAFGPQGLFNACYTEEDFRSVTPVESCLSYRPVIRHSSTGSYKDYVCNEYEKRNVIISRTYTQIECVKRTSGECTEYDSVTSVYPTGFKLVVIEAEGPEAATDFIFMKTYAIPSCP